MPEKTELQSQLIENGALNQESINEGFIVDGSIAGVITVNMKRTDDLFMRFQHYFGRIFTIAKELGTVAIVVNLEGESKHTDWFQLLLNHGLHPSRENKLRYQITRSDMEHAEIG